ncbi:MAG: hypothetical protein H0X65_08535 [Gemmatimonadetes bacterium]|nr:hypothetical protein [Gemmatimonadota bacterium]
MLLATLPAVLELTGPNTRLLFFVNLLTVIAVSTFACTVIVVLFRRSDQRRLEEQRLAAIGIVTARILHQIKNPLQSLILQAELIEQFDGEDARELRRESSAAVVGEAHRLAMMLNELSVWASGARRNLARVPTELHLLIEELVRRERREAERRGVDLELTRLDRVVASVDAYFLRQAVENLLRNSLEAMHGQEDARLRVELERLGSVAAVRVIDNGPGIAAERLREVLEPFVSTKSSGMGLGLPISKDIVEGHGGEFRVESKPGAGTTFTLLLPIDKHAAARSAAIRPGGTP